MQTTQRHAESGNMIFFILLAIVLIGLVTAALRSTGIESANIDREELAIKASQVRQYGSELERAVTMVMNNGISETDISFAPDIDSAPAGYGTYGSNPQAEIFNPAGGGAAWRAPPSGISTASHWEFYGTTHAPGVGSEAADLIAVLPNVTEAFCQEANRMSNQTNAQPEDTADCIYSAATGRFAPASAPFSAAPNTMNDATFSTIPAAHGCVKCGTDYHFYYVLMAR